MNSAPISWKAKRQDCVTLSSAEAELRATDADSCLGGQCRVHLDGEQPREPEVHEAHRHAPLLSARLVSGHPQRRGRPDQELARAIVVLASAVPVGDAPGVHGFLRAARANPA
eukprot:2701466-Rhodomonas_salina.1